MTLPTYHDFMDYGNPDNDYHYLSHGYQNANTFTVYTETTGVYGHSIGESVLLVGQAPFSVDSLAKSIGVAPPTPPGGGWPSGGPQLLVAGINPLDQVLFRDPGFSDQAATKLYDARSGAVVDLAPVVGAPYLPALTIPIALDDRGRILVESQKADGSTDLLLLVPNGLSPEPVSIPEPSLTAFAACAATGLMIGKVWRKKVSKRTTTG
jgi:hypothetical protein